MRKFKGNRRKDNRPEVTETQEVSTDSVIKNTISYSDMMAGGVINV